MLEERLDRWRALAERPAAKIAGKVARIAFFVGMIAWMMLKVRAIGWRDVVASLPVNPLFYILFVAGFLILPASENAVFPNDLRAAAAGRTAQSTSASGSPTPRWAVIPVNCSWSLGLPGGQPNFRPRTIPIGPKGKMESLFGLPLGKI